MQSMENLSRNEKLRLMEVLWDDKSRDADTFLSPAWHAQALDEAERAVTEHQAGCVSWEAAKKRYSIQNWILSPC
jgi:hypothetical protein